MHNIKRIFSCLSVLAVCLLANIGLEAKALPIISSAPQIAGNKQQNESFILYSGTEVVSSEEIKTSYHYSHSSHYSHTSHRSHYSSRY